MEEENKKVEDNIQSIESVSTEPLEERKIETDNNVKQKKTIPPVLFVMLLLLFFCIGIILGKVVFGGESKDKNENAEITNNENTEITNTEKTNTENNGNNENLLFDDNAKSQIDDFIKLAMYHSYEGTTIADALSNGLTGLTIEQKELLTYFSVSDSMVQLTSDMVPEKYKNDSYWDVSSGSIMLYQLPIQTFKDEYKRLFKEEYTIKGEDYNFGACPVVFKTDLELGNMYLTNQCGGTGIFGYLYSNYKYESDDNYYYVYQYVAYYEEDWDAKLINIYKTKSKEKVLSVPYDKYKEVGSSFEENKSKFETIKWKFDKNFNFISTENLG